jgi:hypothetical protein
MSEPKQLGDGLKGLMAGLKRLNDQSGEAQPVAAKAEPATNPEPPAPKQSGRVHPDRRGPLVLANAITEGMGEKMPDRDALSYYSPELIQATLPHSDPKTRDWIRRNGDFTLTVSSGIDKNGQVLGVPYGAFPRLALAHIHTEVIRTHSRRIELSSGFNKYLKEVGYTGNYRGNGTASRNMQANMMRLLKANITFEYEQGSALAGRTTGLQMHVAPRFDLWWDFKSPEQDSLFGSWIELSEDFYRSILARKVPLKTEVLKALHRDIMALDVYMWVSYRLAAMENKQLTDLRVSYAALHSQFGTGIAEENYRQFRQKLKKAFAKVAQFWVPPGSKSGESALLYEFGEDGVILYSSPKLVSRSRAAKSQNITALLEARRFDEATRKQARLLAGARFTVDHLEKQYFDWLEEKGITPDSPPAHFLDFVKRHIARNR